MRSLRGFDEKAWSIASQLSRLKVASSWTRKVRVFAHDCMMAQREMCFKISLRREEVDIPLNVVRRQR